MGVFLNKIKACSVIQGIFHILSVKSLLTSRKQYVCARTPGYRGVPLTHDDFRAGVRGLAVTWLTLLRQLLELTTTDDNVNRGRLLIARGARTLRHIGCPIAFSQPCRLLWLTSAEFPLIMKTEHGVHRTLAM